MGNQFNCLKIEWADTTLDTDTDTTPVNHVFDKIDAVLFMKTYPDIAQFIHALQMMIALFEFNSNESRKINKYLSVLDGLHANKYYDYMSEYIQMLYQKNVRINYLDYCFVSHCYIPTECSLKYACTGFPLDLVK
jgi:hypothetical protein